MIDRIGYTKDGLVFLVLNGEYEGKPIQTITQMLPDAARRVAKALAEAAEKVPHVGNSPDLN